MTTAQAPPAGQAPRLPAAIRRHLTIAVLAALGNYACAWAGYTFTIRPAGVSIVWPGSGFVLALLVLINRRCWPAALAGALLGNAIGDHGHGATWAVALSGSAANMLEALVAAILLVRMLGRRITLGTLREVGIFLLGAVILSNAATALAGATFLHVATDMPLGRAWFVWWTGDGMGMLMVAPAILTWAHLIKSGKRLQPALILEATGISVVIGVLGLVINGRIGTRYAILNQDPYLAFPLLFWSAVRLGPAGAATATLVLCGVTEWNASHAVGPFVQAGQSGLRQVSAIYLYLALAGLSSLVPAAMLSERRRADARRRESDQRFRQMAEHIKEAFFIVDLTSARPIYVSPTWSEIWGRPIEDGYDPKVWVDAIHPEDRAMVTESQAVAARGEPSTSRYRVVRPDGATRWVRGRAFPVRDDTGRVYRIVGISEDITELRRIEERFAQSQKLEAVGQLAGGVAHDFNNLLTVILGYTEVLLASLPSQDSRRDELQEIQTAATSAAQLTRQLLLFSRKEVQQPEVVRLNDLLQGVGKMLKRLIGEHIELTFTLDDRAGAVNIDRGSLEQVIVNLVVNARDAMPKGGTLVIASANADLAATAAQSLACPPGRYVMLSVRDNGVGMDDTTKARVFEPFFTTKAPGKGTGLGLATVYGIVRQSGGAIALESALDRGTTFTIYLPRVDEVAAPAPKSEQSVPRGRGETVLVAEDEPAVRSLVRRTLVALGYIVLEAPDGSQALALAKAHQGPIHLLLTDVVMPRMTGRVLADHLALVRPETKVLYMSGYTDDAIVHHGVLSARLQYIEKPLRPEVLATKIRTLLDAPSA